MELQYHDFSSLETAQLKKIDRYSGIPYLSKENMLKFMIKHTSHVIWLDLMQSNGVQYRSFRLFAGFPVLSPIK